jgi:CPA1 family monovalent cation:H+ antiporter
MSLVGYSMVLLIIAIVVALIARRLHVPYTVGLVVAGIGLALTRVDIGISLTPGFFFELLLPPLLFEAALNLSWKELRRDMFPVLALATGGVVLAAIFGAIATKYLLGWSWEVAVLFSILIAATDPVAVIALFKDIRVTGRVRLLVESESLFNDAVVAVLFAVALSWVQSGHISVLGFAQSFTLSIVGSLIAGGLCSLVAIALVRQTDDHLVETALTATAAYGSFILAQSFGASGILATVIAGMLIGNFGALRSDGESPLSEMGRAFVLNFWEFAAFLADSIIFLLIGLRVAVVPFGSFGWAALAWVILVTGAARALTVYPIAGLFSRSRWAISKIDQHILWWGGLRGALAIALSLSLPQTMPMHDQVVIATFGAVAFSVLVQGITMPLLLRQLGIARDSARST